MNYQVEISICIGNKQPIPIPDFPEMPCYIFGTVGPVESRTAAEQRMETLATLNPGYKFTMRHLPENGTAVSNPLSAGGNASGADSGGRE